MLSIASSSCDDLFEPGLLPVSEAQNRILEQVQAVPGSERVPLIFARQRVLAKSVVSPLDVPAFANAAVDGFAVRGSDLPAPGQSGKFKVAGEALSGHPFVGAVRAGHAVRIMTGAPLPEGADTVLMQEHVQLLSEDQILVGDRHRPGENVRFAGEDIGCGETVLTSGKLLTPPDLGLIASLGVLEIEVRRKPIVAVLSTGDEILAQGTPYVPGKLYDSNRFSLMGALAKLPVEVLDFGIVPDDQDRLEAALREAAETADAVISSGGVSVGEADYTKKVLAKLGNIEFWKVAIKPGRPLAFGRLGKVLFFGLPGNPVAVLVTFYCFVLPALYRLAGTEAPLLPALPATTLEPLRKKPGRTEFQRGILSRGGLQTYPYWQVKTTGKQGSGILSSMSLGNCFIVLEHERGPVTAGESVTVWPFSALL